MKRVAVVILNFKVRELTLKCLESVLKSSFKNLLIIVIDNNSKDGLELELPKLKAVHFIQTGTNLGYTGGNNVGIKYALKQGCDFIFVLNPDTTVEPQRISYLIKAFDNPSVGAVSPKILFAGTKKIWYAGGIFDKANVIGSHRGVDKQDQDQYNEAEETDYVTGAALFIRSDVLERVGLFDERYFLYYEDADLSFRIKRAGFKCWYEPRAILYHKNAQSTGLGSPLQDYYITRNRMLFAFKFLPFRTRFAILREAIKNWQIPARRKAFLDFLLGRFGKGD